MIFHHRWYFDQLSCTPTGYMPQLLFPFIFLLYENEMTNIFLVGEMFIRQGNVREDGAEKGKSEAVTSIPGHWGHGPSVEWQKEQAEI